MAITQIISPNRNGYTSIIDYTDSSDTVYSITMKNNALHFLPTVTSLTLSADSGMLYTGIEFTASSSSPTVSYPSTWIFIGDSCTDGVFTAESSAQYRIAIEYSYSFSTYIGSVQAVPTLS